MNELSEESLNLLRDMQQSEAWRIYESVQQEQVKALRDLAKSQSDINARALYYDLAQGREDAITNINEILYGRH